MSSKEKKPSVVKKEKKNQLKKRKPLSPGRYTKLGKSSQDFLNKYIIVFVFGILGIVFTSYGFVNDIKWMWVIGVIFLALMSFLFNSILFKWLGSLFRFFFP